MSEPTRPAIDQGVALAAWTHECLSGSTQRLVWMVDLERDVGTPDGIGDPDGYNDRRWTKALGRLRSAMAEMQTTIQARTELVLIVVCKGVGPYGAPRAHKIELEIPHTIDVAVAAKSPPYGRWLWATDAAVAAWTESTLPSTFFIDGVPF